MTLAPPIFAVEIWYCGQFNNVSNYPNPTCEAHPETHDDCGWWLMFPKEAWDNSSPSPS